MITIVLEIFRVKHVAHATVCVSLGEDNLICLCISSFVGVCVLLPLLFVTSAFSICIFIGAEAPT